MRERGRKTRRVIVKTRPILTILFVALFLVSVIAWILFGVNYLLSAVRSSAAPPPPASSEAPFVEGWRQDSDKKCEGTLCSSRDLIYVSEASTNSAGSKAFRDRFVAAGWKVKEPDPAADPLSFVAERGVVWAIVTPDEAPADPAAPPPVTPTTARLKVTLGFGTPEQARAYSREGVIGRHIGGFFWIVGSMTAAALVLGLVLWISDPWDDDTIMLEEESART